MKRLLLIALILLGAILRLYQPCFLSGISCLSEDSEHSQIVPPSLNWDETSLGYNAYSILKTGKDEWGKTFPISFEAFGDFKLPGYIYTSVPFVAILGLNDFSVRLPSQLAGILSLLILYLVVEKLTGKKSVSLVAVGLLAISPWHIFLSRIAVEANLALFFFLCGFYFFLSGLDKPKRLIFSAFLFGATLFTYNSARVFVPLFVLSLIWIYRTKLWQIRKKLLVPIIILGVFGMVGAYLAFFRDSNSRYFWVALVDQGAVNYLNQARAVSHWNHILTDLVYNRYSYFLSHAFLNYFSHFSPNFLFFKGGSDYQFSVPNYGLLYLIELPFLLLGFLNLWREKKRGYVILAWLLIAPIPSAITREAPHALRAIFMLGSLQIIGALGIVDFFILIKKLPLRIAASILLSLVFIFSLWGYYSNYLNKYPYQYSESWQYGYKEAYQEIDTINSFSGKIFISKKYGEPHIFYLFDKQYDPLKYQTNPTLIRYSRSNWRWVDQLDNITFVNDWEVKSKLRDEKDALLLTSPGNYPNNFSPLKTINFLDGTKAFEIVVAR